MKLQFENKFAPLSPVENKFDLADSYVNYPPKVLRLLEKGVKAAKDRDRIDEAKYMFLRATEAEPKCESVWLWLASISEYPEELIIYLNKVLEINPENEHAIKWAKEIKMKLANTFVQRGLDAMQGGNEEAAKQCLLQAIFYDSKNEKAWSELAVLSQHVREKISGFQKDLNTNPENDQIRELLEEARKFLDEILQSTSKAEAAWILESKHEGSFDKKLHLLERILSVNPKNEEALFLFAKTKTNEPKVLLSEAKKAIAKNKNDVASEFLQKALGINPQIEEAWLLKSYLTVSFSKKIECFEKILEINPENEFAKANLDSLHSLLQKPISEENTISQNREIKDETWECISEPNRAKNSESESNPTTEARADESTLKQSESVLESHKNKEPIHTNKLGFIKGNGLTKEKLEGVSLPPDKLESVDYDKTVDGIDVEEEKINDEVIQEEDFSISSPKPTSEFDAVSSIDEKLDETAYKTRDDLGAMELEPVAEENSPIDEPEPTNEFDVSHSIGEEINEAAHEARDDLGAMELEPVAEEDFPIDEPEPTNEFDVSHSIGEEILNDLETKKDLEAYSFKSKHELKVACQFCGEKNGPNVNACFYCGTILSLSDVELFFTNSNKSKDIVLKLVEDLEIKKELRELIFEELYALGIGHLNLRNYRKGLKFLAKASEIRQEDTLLAAQLDTLSFHLTELKKDEIETSVKSRKILVAEASATARKLISSKLEMSGYETICAADGIEALKIAEETSPDLILLDIAISGMDGYQVCKKIRESNYIKDAPIIMTAGKDSVFDEVKGEMAEPTCLIAKPFGPETLMRVIKEYID